MQGLLLKDLFILKKTFRYLWIFLLVAIFQPDVLSIMSIMFLMLLGLTTFSYDELAKWDKYANVLPLTRKQIVGAKYIFVSIALVSVFVVNVGLTYILHLFKNNFDYKETMFVMPFIFIAILILLSILYPLVFKFGPQKSRIYIFIIAFAPSILVAFLQNQNALPPMPSDATLKLIGYASPFVACLLFFLSFLVSVKIYERKEF